MCEDAKPAPAPAPGPQSSDLTPRQRAIVRAYFAAGCRTQRAAQALGIKARRVRRVKATPPARVYLAELEAMAAHAITQARAAQILSPMLHLSHVDMQP